MRDHGAETDGYGDPRESCICRPTIEQIADSSIDEADAKRPKAHLRLLDTAVAASEKDDNSVCKNAGEVSEYTTDEGRKEHESCGGCGEVVGFVSHDFGDYMEVSDSFNIHVRNGSTYLY
jgi:hypothetical protein